MMAQGEIRYSGAQWEAHHMSSLSVTSRNMSTYDRNNTGRQTLMLSNLNDKATHVHDVSCVFVKVCLIVQVEGEL